MKLPLNWLRDYVDIEMAPEALCELLTMSGLEVEGMTLVGQDLHHILVGKIIEFVPHPNADHLFICQVDVGRAQLQVVCGAPNLSRGALAPTALPGTKLPGGTLVEEALIRGVRSSGMLLAEDEMGLTEDHTGVMVLPGDFVPGDPVTRILPPPDYVLDIGITPNRPDCTCVLGIAREIAAKTGRKTRQPETGLREEGPAIDRVDQCHPARPRRMSPVRRGHDPGRRSGTFPFLDATPASSLRAQVHQQCGGCDQLRAPGIWPAPSRL